MGVRASLIVGIVAIVALPMSIIYGPTAWVERNAPQEVIKAAAEKAQLKNAVALQWAAYEVDAGQFDQTKLEESKKKLGQSTGLDEHTVNRKIATWNGQAQTLSTALLLSSILAWLITAYALSTANPKRDAGKAGQARHRKWMITTVIGCAAANIAIASYASEKGLERLYYANAVAQTQVRQDALTELGRLQKQHRAAKAEIGNEIITVENHTTNLHQSAVKLESAKQKQAAAQRVQESAQTINLGLSVLLLVLLPWSQKARNPREQRQTKTQARQRRIPA